MRKNSILHNSCHADVRQGWYRRRAAWSNWPAAVDKPEPYHWHTRKFESYGQDGEGHFTVSVCRLCSFGWTVLDGPTVSKHVDSIKESSSLCDILETWGRPPAARGSTEGAAKNGGILIGFWKCFSAACPNPNTWPILFINSLSHKSQSAVERLFSQYDSMMATRRNRLSSSTQKLMFTKINLMVWYLCTLNFSFLFLPRNMLIVEITGWVKSSHHIFPVQKLSFQYVSLTVVLLWTSW
jgi:hypothetical protein